MLNRFSRKLQLQSLTISHLLDELPTIGLRRDAVNVDYGMCKKYTVCASLYILKEPECTLMIHQNQMLM